MRPAGRIETKERIREMNNCHNWGLFSTGSCAATKTIGILGMVFVVGDGDTSIY